MKHIYETLGPAGANYCREVILGRLSGEGYYAMDAFAFRSVLELSNEDYDYDSDEVMEAGEPVFPEKNHALNRLLTSLDWSREGRLFKPNTEEAANASAFYLIAGMVRATVAGEVTKRYRSGNINAALSMMYDPEVHNLRHWTGVCPTRHIPVLLMLAMVCGNSGKYVDEAVAACKHVAGRTLLRHGMISGVIRGIRKDIGSSSDARTLEAFIDSISEALFGLGYAKSPMVTEYIAPLLHELEVEVYKRHPADKRDDHGWGNGWSSKLSRVEKEAFDVNEFMYSRALKLLK